LANVMMGGLLLIGTGAIADWLAFTASERVWQLLLWIITGGAVYIGTLLALGVRPQHLKAH
jgi:putative peptidoglycan lipid II flippase